MIDKIYTIWCDGQGCIEWYSNGEHFRSEVKKNAKKKGWTVNEYGEFCPECGKEFKKGDI